MMDSKTYYKDLMTAQAYCIGDPITNSLGQKIDFYECPINGDGACVIAVCHELKVAEDTDFFETDDLTAGGDYTPNFVNGRLVLDFEM